MTHTNHVSGGSPWDWRILLNGYADELAYEHGLADTRLPFAEFRRRSLINTKVRAADRDPSFFERIRDGLPNPSAMGS